MGNNAENELKTNSQLFVLSLEQSYITVEMLPRILKRWTEHGKPLFLVPKDFKERILTSATDQQIKLNYLRWLTCSLEIDMFEMLTLLILYARGSLEDRLGLVF